MDSVEKEVTEDEEMSENKTTSNVGSQVKKVVDGATSLAENARDTIEKDMDTVNKALEQSMDDVAAKVQDAVEEDLEQIGKAMGVVNPPSKKAMEPLTISEAIANVTKAVAKVPTDVRDIVEEDATELAEKVEEALDTMVADVQDVVESDL
eukprot:CAMPEP_0172329236 /NCGR_PEP_ID=MMETSP1058-20130122/60775_1 /TAXON_ID=83371 /ORGANISM="Detonula confervacea, Strain CCMP 353" /LENGTH=150 /DNA_ID=CAMNT_0013046399 /DNA_START=2795 /DNA_END=3247 /DNA_ORIENTATION=+